MQLWWRASLIALALSLSSCQTRAPGEGTEPPLVLERASLATGAAVATDTPGATPAAPDGTRAPLDPSLTAYTDPGDLPRLQLVDGSERLPLKHTDVRAQITGFAAEVEVSQTYENTHDGPIEAVYVFPLPENSAVHSMKMVIGEREIVAEIKRREQARRVYERARAAGKTAALLEQERPNVFTQSVANIAPGERIDVVIRYVQDLTYDRGQYEFVFPMVVGPRFHQGAPVAGPRSGTGTKDDTTLVPDAARVSPAIAGPGTRTGHDISLRVDVHAGLPIVSHEVPTHDVSVRRHPAGRLELALADKAELPNRDFVLRYAVAQSTPRSTLLLQPDARGRGGTFALVVQPPELDIEALVGRRELMFVVDNSGSMSGVPLAMCQYAMRESLRQLRPVDTFNIITFAGSTARLFDAPRPANADSITQALAFVDDMRAGGGTYIQNAVQESLQGPVAEGRHRYVFFMTDGAVSIEDRVYASARQLVAAQEAQGRRARVFGFGVGSSPNRHLIEQLSSAGRGLSVYASNREDPARAVDLFFHRIDHAVIEGLRVDWGGAQVEHVSPDPLPDLFASRPLILHGRYTRPPRRAVVVHGQAAGAPVTVRAEVEKTDAARSSISVLWARSRIDDLMDTLALGSDERERVEAEIIDLALAHHVVTRYTSLVAVDSSRVVKGASKRIAQPVDAPEDVDVAAAGGDVYGDVVLSPDGANVSSRGRTRHSPLIDGHGRSMRLMKQVPRLAELERKQEQQERKRLMLLEREAIAAEAAPEASSSKSSSTSTPTPTPKPTQPATARVTFGTPRDAGPRDQAALQRAAAAGREAVRKCFERAIPSGDVTPRTVTLRVTVDAAGAVTAVTIFSTDLGSVGGERCMLEAAKTWTFGSGAAQTFTIPIELRWTAALAGPR